MDKLPSWIQYGAPTLDHPFGLHLWPIFNHAVGSIKPYNAEQFRFVEGLTPMSTLSSTVTMLITYYVVIFGGREVMRNFEPLKLNGLFKIHNFYLTAISLVLLLLFVEQLVPTLSRNGILFGICDHRGGWTDQLVILYYLNYLTKYLELLDTVFLVLKKKPLTFLHTYHHGATALLCYTQLLGHTAVSWVPITLNLTVHVVMYWYYFQSARGIKIWWKKYITIMQITQFIIDLGFVYFAAYTYFARTYFPWAPNMGNCAGEEFAAIAGICILSSYLLLFISFYLATYKKPAPKRRGRATSALIEMKDEQIPTVAHVRRRLSGTGPAIANGSPKDEASSTAASLAPSTARVTRSRKA